MTWLVSLLAVAGALAVGAPAAAADRVEHPNVLVFVADDLGVDKLRIYGPPGDTFPATPAIDALAAEGVRFDQAYVHPSCSPTRAALLTGLDARRTGIGGALNLSRARGGLPDEAVLIPEILDDAYTSAAIGKWHVANQGEDAATHPLRNGFAHHRGPLGNLSDHNAEGLEQHYFDWLKATDGVVERTRRYIPADNAREAKVAVRNLPEPWFLYVALTAPHRPLHVPPQEWRHDPHEGTWTDPHRYDVMVESVDLVVSRTLEAMDPEVRARTIVVFLGDNGTPHGGHRPPFRPDRGKGTPDQGGIRVPWIVSGPGIARGAHTDALVSGVDLMPTLAALTGSPLPDDLPVPIDGVSFADVLRDPASPGRREVVTLERFLPAGFRKGYSEHVRVAYDGEHKLVWDDVSGRETFHEPGPWADGRSLLRGTSADDLPPDAAEALARLREALTERGGPLGTVTGRWAAEHPDAVLADPDELPRDDRDDPDALDVEPDE